VSDLTERLLRIRRDYAMALTSSTRDTLLEAADRIAELEAEVERLKVWSSDSHVTELEAEVERLRVCIQQHQGGCVLSCAASDDE